MKSRDQHTEAAADRAPSQLRAVQLRLLPGGTAEPDWVLDERTRKVGRQGVAQAREILRRVAPPDAGPPGELTGSASTATTGSACRATKRVEAGPAHAQAEVEDVQVAGGAQRGDRLGVGVGPRPDRLVAGPERVDQRGRVVEVLERAERDQRVLDLEAPRSGPGSR